MYKKQTEKKLVAKSNSLINACYRLSLNEKRFVAYAIAHINPTRSNNPRTFEINITNFAEFFGIDNKNLYRDLSHIAKKQFLNRTYSYTNESGNLVLANWLEKVEYHDKKGLLKITFTPDIMGELQSLERCFTQYDLKQISGFKSVHAIRLYEICLKQYNMLKNAPYNINKRGIKFTVEIEALKTQLGVEDKYTKKNNSRFLTQALANPLTEINQKADITITYKLEKLGRAWHTINFHVFKKLTPEQIQAKKINKQKSLSNQRAELEQLIRNTQSAINEAHEKGWGKKYISELCDTINKAQADLIKVNKKQGIE